MMVGRLLSFWDGISPGAMLKFRWVSDFGFGVTEFFGKGQTWSHSCVLCSAFKLEVHGSVVGAPQLGLQNLQRL